MHIAPRAELDQPDALALADLIAHLNTAYDAACNQAGDLFEHHGRALAPHRDHVLFVVPRALLAAGHQKPAFFVLHLLDHPADGCAVHMNVENVQKDTDAVPPALGFDRHHLAVRRRYRHRPRRNLPLRIAEEIQAEQRQHAQRGRIPRSGEPKDNGPSDAQRERVVNPSGYDLQTSIFAWRGAPGRVLPEEDFQGPAWGIREQFPNPPLLGREVTSQPRYSSVSVHRPTRPWGPSSRQVAE